MAHTEKLPSGRWRGIYRLADGRKRSKTFVHKKAAERWATAQEQQVADGRTRDPHAGKIAWGQWRLRWWEARTARSSTQRSAQSRLERHVAPHWDTASVNAITPTAVQAWVTSLTRQGLAPSTVRGAFYLLSGSLKAALRDGLIDVNPCTGVKLPTLPAEPERYLRDDETDALLAALRGPYRILVEVMLEAGLRLGEAVALHRHRVDFDNRRISVAQAWDQVERQVQPHTKSGHQRAVPMSDRLEAVLLEWFGHSCPARGDRCGFRHAPGDVCRSELVVRGPAGALIDPTNFTTRVFARALRDAGIGHCRPHDLRHTWASRLVTAGVPSQLVQRWGGWESVGVMNRYGRHMGLGDDVLRGALAVGRRGAERGAERGAGRVTEGYGDLRRTTAYRPRLHVV